jgi:methylphosphotriester-DNA--protein-cysteine methyltransferase
MDLALLRTFVTVHRAGSFTRAAALMSRPGARPLAEVAVAAGYYDQSHLTNDVRDISGLSPARLQARRLPDDGGVFDRDGT